MKSEASDVLIVGGGIVGLTTAWKLAVQGVKVTLLDRRETGSEASWAGAGMLPPGTTSSPRTPESVLRCYSNQLWPGLSEQLRVISGIDNGFRRCGAIQLFDETNADSLLPLTRNWTAEGICHTQWNRDSLQQATSAVNPRFEQAVWLPDFCQVRNPRHLKSVRVACQQNGVSIVEHAATTDIVTDGRVVRAIRCGDQIFKADRFCITAGAWTTLLLQTVGVTVPIRPVRGQIVQLRVSRLPFRCVIELGKRYLVPRPDGLILVGSTEEDAGYVRENTAQGVADLLRFAADLVPELKHASIVRMWSGLRPGTPDELPLLGTVPGFENLFVGAGHFRSGLQMSPATAQILADLLLDRPLSCSLNGLQPDRFAENSLCAQ
ncbi:MAG: glycine oxidase ThiO [Planctomycetaceae bacterium]|nr:glycine oxidase ThiO [Planctomycetaceae bacterium]